MQRVLVRPEGTRRPRGVPRAGRARRRRHRELPARRGRPPGHRLRRRLGRATRGIVYCSTTGFGQTGPRAAVGRRTTSTTWPSAASCDCTAAPADGGPPIPGATIADSAGGGMHAVMAILAALVRRADAPARAPTSTCRSPTACSRLMALAGRRVPRHRRGAGARPRHSSPAATPVTTPTRARDGRWLARRRHRTALLGQPLQRARARAVGGAPERRRGAGRDPRRRCAPRSSRGTATTGSLSSPPPTRACTGARRSPEVVDDAQFAARGAFVEAQAP